MGCQAAVCTVAPGRTAGEPLDVAMLVEVEVRQGCHLAPVERQMHLVVDAPYGRERRHHVRPEVAVSAEHEQTRFMLTAIDQHIGHRGCAAIAHARFHAWIDRLHRRCLLYKPRTMSIAILSRSYTLLPHV